MKETDDAKNRERYGKYEYRDSPSGSTCGKPGHDDRKQHVDDDRTQHGDDSAIGSDFSDQNFIVVEYPDGIRRIGRIAHRGEDREHQGIHEEYPYIFHQSGPCRITRKQQHGTKRHTYDTQIIRPPLSKLRVCVINKPSREYIGNRIDYL